MKEYIEREYVLEYMDKLYNHHLTMRNYSADGATHDCINVVIDAPAADVVEVRHGRWKLNRNGSGTCSECGMTQNDVWDFDNWQRYCGCCGAKMDKEE